MRRRDTKRWGVGKLYPNREFFLESSICEGLHTIQAANLLIDLLVRDRGSETTLVFFHASVTEQTTFPQFSGDGLAKSAGANLIAISDPMLAYTAQVRLGWHIGVRTIGSFTRYAVPIIKHIIEQQGATNLIFAGSSGGGYAAMNFGQYFPDSAILCINPRLNLASRPRAEVSRYLKYAFRAEGRTAYNRLRREYITENSADFYPDGLTSDVAILQNSQDTEYYEGQLLPFVESLDGDPRLWVRTDPLGDGHIPYPRETIREVIGRLADTSNSTAQNLSNSSFNNIANLHTHRV